LVAEIPFAPGNVTVTPGNRIILTLHPFFSPNLKVVELGKNGNLTPFPSPDWNNVDARKALAWDSVLGIQSDSKGLVWMLDTGMRQGSVPKLVSWDTVQNRLHKIIYLTPPTINLPITYPDSVFVNDLAVDRTHDTVYISHSATPEKSGIIVVDLATGLARDVLQGHSSVKPEDVHLVINNRVLNYTMPDAGKLNLLIGVNPIALDAKDEWLYYAPMNGKSLYRIRTEDLRNTQLSSDDIGNRVERYSDKPICDGMSIDTAGNIYVSDLQSNSVGAITPDRQYKELIKDPRISWLESFSYSPDGFLYFVCSRIHESAPLNNGKNQAKAPFHVFRMKPLAPGVVGR
jgi:sugar lactone lactonase YvrE